MPVDFIVDDLPRARPPLARVWRAPLFDDDIAGLGDGACRHKASWDVFSRRPGNAYTAVQLRRLRSDRFRIESEWPLSGVHGRSGSIGELGQSRSRRKAYAQGTVDGPDHQRS